MRRRIALLLAAMLTMGVMTAAPAVADSHEGGTYLALGDSVPAGFRPGAPITPDGYPSFLFDKLEKNYGFDELVNLSCPGDDSNEMLDGDAGLDLTPVPPNPPNIGSACYGTVAPLPPGGESQLAAALEYIDPGDVRLITLTIGANDIFLCGESDDPDTCIPEKLGQWAINLGVLPFGEDPSAWPINPDGIIPQLRLAAGPDVPIVAMNYYNPDLAHWLTTEEEFQDAYLAGQVAFSAGGNDFIGAVYAALGVPVVDVADAFSTFKTSGKTPKNVKEACKLTLMCEKYKGKYMLSDWTAVGGESDGDIHPSEKGHKKIAKAFEKLIKKHKLLK